MPKYRETSHICSWQTYSVTTITALSRLLQTRTIRILNSVLLFLLISFLPHCLYLIIKILFTRNTPPNFSIALKVTRDICRACTRFFLARNSWVPTILFTLFVCLLQKIWRRQNWRNLGTNRGKRNAKLNRRARCRHKSRFKTFILHYCVNSFASCWRKEVNSYTIKLPIPNPTPMNMAHHDINVWDWRYRQVKSCWTSWNLHNILISVKQKYVFNKYEY